MKAFVFTDKALKGQAGQFAWLAMDTEKSRNAALRRRLAANALPSFFVLDPRTEKVLLRWVGGASVGQFKRLLEDGRLAYSGKDGTGLEATLARADRAYGGGDYASAAKLYQEALAAAPAGLGPRHARAVEALLFALQTVGENRAGVELALREAGRLRHTPSFASLGASGLDCALSLPDSTPQRKAWADTLEGMAREALADTSLHLAGDDRSGIYGSLIEARKEAGDSLGARRDAEAWSAMLDAEAARAATPEQRAVYDPHRLSAYIELGRPEQAVPMLEASERDLPGDYNPSARLAVAYRSLKLWDQALAASDRALAKSYGPRRLGILNTRADIYLGRTDTTAALKTLEGALAEAQALPEGQRSENTIGALKKRIAKLR
jgi:tetratricopeptide (TPR) repeat protein